MQPRPDWCLRMALVAAPLLAGGAALPAGAQILNPATALPGAPGAGIPRPSTDHPGLIAGVTIGELYTDNLELAPAGAPRASSWVTEVQPFVAAAIHRPRLVGTFNFALTGYQFSGASRHQHLAQSLDARAMLTVLPDHLFIDGAGSYGRTVADDRLPRGPGTLFFDENQLNVGTLSLSPYWVQDLHRAGTLTVRYTRGRVVYNGRGLPDIQANLLQGIRNATGDGAQVSLVSPEYQRWGWNLAYTNQRIVQDGQPGVRFAMAKAGISALVAEHLRLLLEAGKESQFAADGTVQQLGAPFWDAGFNWVTPRNDFKATAGHRFYGQSYALAWTHQAARVTTHVNYDEEPTTYDRTLLAMQTGIGTSLPVDYGQYRSALAGELPYLSRRWLASASYAMPRSELGVTLYDELRTYFVDRSNNQRIEDAGIAWSFHLGARGTLTPALHWQRYVYADRPALTYRYAEAAYVYQLNTRNFGSVQVRHADSLSAPLASATSGYRVNVIFLRWTHLL